MFDLEQWDVSEVLNDPSGGGGLNTDRLLGREECFWIHSDRRMTHCKESLCVFMCVCVYACVCGCLCLLVLGVFLEILGISFYCS